MIVKHFVDRNREEQAFKDLAESASQAQQAEKLDGVLGLISDLPEPGDLTESGRSDESQSLPDTTERAESTEMVDSTESAEAVEPNGATNIGYTEYAALYAENSDFVGWLHVDNTAIDYPVMFTPNEPEYYLRRAFDRTYSLSGTLFVNKDCTIDSDFYIIHGHNMKNDVMFGTLDKYAKKAFWETTPTFSFTTLTERREYEVFAALESRVLYQDEVGYRYYYQVGDLTEEGYNELVAWFKQNALYDTGITPTPGEQIVLLSTCSDYDDNVRFIVAARRIDQTDSAEK